MAGINAGKVLSGGLVAGVIVLVSDFVLNGVLLAADMEAMAKARNLDLDGLATPGVIAVFVFCDLLFGILTVWTYAAIRPRFGSGPGTAVYAGLMVFLPAMLLYLSFTTMGMFEVAVFVKSAVLWAIVLVVAALAGARAYSET